MIDGKYQVLIVEDSKILRDIEAAQLLKVNFAVLTCETGEECLEILAHRIDVDAVLLDIDLPGITGLNVLEKIRETKSSLELAVIMVTGENNSATMVSALRSGANDYITKPVEFEVMKSRLHAHLQLMTLSAVQEKIKKAEAIKALVATYNHEINNSLMVAMGNMSKGIEGLDEVRFEKVKVALLKISETVKRMKLASEQELQMTPYAGEAQMLKI